MPAFGKSLGVGFLMFVVLIGSVIVIPPFFNNLVGNANSASKDMIRILVMVFALTIIGLSIAFMVAE